MKLKTLINNPLKIFSWWLFFELLFIFIGIPILNDANYGSEQIELLSFLYSLEIFIYGFLIICVLTPILFLEWSEKYWYISLFIGMTFLFLLIFIIKIKLQLPILNRVVTNFKSVYLN